ncbi:CoA transferase [Ottowia caeni]|uniref:CaiB/BaiF CoA transferase family protein n=1 Tax=Ottowia caeni TaxID=2870339 RepID=UPI001E4CA5F3|nr:CoA transferase [Ottowia caeni]
MSHLSTVLAGLRVLDLSQGIAGPYCTSILQQQGAEVIKLEPPGGDWARKMGFAPVVGFTAPVIACNAGKRSVCLDLRRPQGVAVARRLARQADIVVQSFRPGVAERLGLGEKKLREEDPRLIYVSISGFGAEGPLADVPATDTVMQAMTGMMVVNQDESGTPRRIGLQVADIATALYAAQMTTAALLHRERVAQGSHVSVSLLQACASFQASAIVDSAIRAAYGASAPSAASAPSGVFQTADGFISLAIGNEAMFASLCDALEQTAWKNDTRFATMGSRLTHACELNAATAECLKRQPSASWVAHLRRHGVLHAEVLNHAQLVQHPQARQQGLFGEIEQAGVGALPFARYPSADSASLPTPAPEVGADNDAVLAEAGYSTHEVAMLRAEKVLVD